MKEIIAKELSSVFIGNGDRLVCLPIALHQKADFSVPVPKADDGLLGKLDVVMKEKYGIDDFGVRIGMTLAEYGTSVGIILSVPNSKTKFATFPIGPHYKRIFTKEALIPRFQRLYKNKGKGVPGFMLKSEPCYIEFSTYKLKQVIKYFKLNEVIIPFSMLRCYTEKEENITLDILGTLPDCVKLIREPVESEQGTTHIISTGSTVE